MIKRVIVAMDEEKHRQRGIYLLPNLFTTAGLFSGFYAIVQAINGNFILAPIAIFVAVLMDGLDGRIARWTNTQSDFGAEYDSLVDMVSFGLAPALLMYEWILSSLGKLGWLAAFIYTAAVAFRLARFNTQLAVPEKRYFYGLPSPSAAMLLAGFIWAVQSAEIAIFDHHLHIVAAILTVIAGMLMVSNIRYHSFKDFDFKERVSFMTILTVPLIFVFIFIDPPSVFFCIFTAYALSGPLAALYRIIFRRGQEEASS